MNLDPVNSENIPLVVLHIGRARDLCFTPTRFLPATEVTDLCDIVTGNFSVIVIPYESSQNLRTYFANEPAPPGTKDEQILIVPFYKRDRELHHVSKGPSAGNSLANGPATTSCPEEAIIAADKGVAPIKAPPTDPSQSCGTMVTPCSQGPPDTADTSQHTDNDQSSVNMPPIKLFCTTLEMMRGVINDLKKPALKSWASTCGIHHTNNPVANKRKLCELLEECSTSGSTAALSLLMLLTKKLKDPSIKLELTANHQPLSLTAAQRKSDLVQYYQNTYHASTTIDFLVLPELGNATNTDQLNTSDIPPTPVNLSTHVNITKSVAKSGSKRNKKHRKKHKKLSQLPSPTNHLVSTDNAVVVELEGASNGEQDCQEKLPTSLSAIQENQSEANGNAHEIVIPEGPRNEHHNETGCDKCEEMKTSLLILQDSLVELKEEMARQKATTDLVLSTPDNSDKKLTSLIKSRVTPLENAIAQMRSDLNLLRAAVEEQNRTLDTLIDSKKDADAAFHTIEKVNRAAKTRIETLEIGQDNLKLAIREVAKSSAAHAAAQTSTVQKTNTTSEATSTQKKESSNNCKPRTETAHQQPEQRPAPTWAEKVSNKDKKPFTKVHKGNATTHKENATSSQRVANNDDGPTTNQPKSRDHVEKKATRSLTSQNSTAIKHQVAFNSKQEPSLSKPKYTYSRHSNGELRYRRHTTLLIHDEHFEDFNSYLFNSQFNVHQLQANSFESLANNTKLLNNTVERLAPDCIYIHTGINDVLKKKAGVISYIEELSDHLLKSTDAQICFSLMIPSTNDSDLNEKINMINTEIVDYISWLHKNEPSSKKRIFSFTNNPLEDYNFYSTNTGFRLRERGQKLLWLRLREGLRKTMRLPRINHNSDNRSRRISNRFSND